MTASPPLVSLEEIREEVAELESPEERIGYLIELGQSLPDLPQNFRTEEYRVLGCQSMVWVVPEIGRDSITFRGTSDAPMVRGLVAILLSVYSGRSPQEIVDYPIEALFDELQLKSFLTPLRSNGLHSMVQRIQSIARSLVPVLAAASMQAESSDTASCCPPSIAIETCRADFPILTQTLANGRSPIYLDNAASSQRPSSVIACMDRVYEGYYANVHRSGHDFAAQSTVAMEASRESLRDWIGAASSEQIIFTSGTTASINLVARSWGDTHLKAGDEILLTEMEHHSNIVPWQQLAERTGATIRWLGVRDDFHLDLDALPRLLNQRTRLVSVTAVSNVLGTINPVRQIVDAAHDIGARVLVDAAQSVPHGGVRASAWDADWIAFSGHKMLGPTGIGVLYGKRDLLDAMPPFLGGGNMIQSVTKSGFVPAGLPHRFEAGTAPIVEAIGMKPAVEYLRGIGSEAILAHERALASRAMQGLSLIPKLRILGPAIGNKTGIISFVVEGMHADQIGQFLNASGIAIRVGHHCAMPLHDRFGIGVSARASFYFYNTIEEVDVFVEDVGRSIRVGRTRT